MAATLSRASYISLSHHPFRNGMVKKKMWHLFFIHGHLKRSLWMLHEQCFLGLSLNSCSCTYCTSQRRDIIALKRSDVTMFLEARLWWGCLWNVIDETWKDIEVFFSKVFILKSWPGSWEIIVMYLFYFVEINHQRIHFNCVKSTFWDSWHDMWKMLSGSHKGKTFLDTTYRPYGYWIHTADIKQISNTALYPEVFYRFWFWYLKCHILLKSNSHVQRHSEERW